jgi:glucosamine kinase
MPIGSPLIAVGVDAGGSRSVAIAMRGEELLRPYDGMAANPQLYGVDRSARAIVEAIRAACAGGMPAAVVVGVAGAGRPAIADALQAALRAEFPQARIAVVDDARIALRGAIAAGDGIVLIAGTGSIAYAEIGDRRYRTGGYGYLLGDEGSGYAIGLAALRLLLRSYDGRASADALTQALAARIGATSHGEVLAYVYENAAPVATVAALAPTVLHLAAEGDRSASAIVQNAAIALFDMLRGLAAMTQAHPAAGCELPLALRGGLLTERSPLTYFLEMRIAHELANFAIVRNAAAPHFGALAQARSLLEKVAS